MHKIDKTLNEREIVYAFKYFDKDNSGTVSLDEFAKVSFISYFIYLGA